MTLAHLEELASILSPQALAVSAAAFSSSLKVERMAETVVNSTVRIFDLISAIKDYSYMDQAPIQEVDLAQSLDTTLTMFNSRLEHVVVERDYDPSTCPIISAYGSELNQVWTELIENALDAMQDSRNPDGLTYPRSWARWSPSRSGTTARASRPRSHRASSSRSTPPSRPARASASASMQSTASSSKHNGCVTVESKPGTTCFQVRLPVERAQAY